MPYKNIEDRRAQARRWAKKNREENREKEAEKAHKYYLDNKERLNRLRRKRRKENPEQYEKDKKSTSAAITKKKQEIKFRLVEFFGGECKLCGIKDHPCIYDFHHCDPAKKETNIAALINQTRDYDITLKEARKCELVCANCHRKLHVL